MGSVGLFNFLLPKRYKLRETKRHRNGTIPVTHDSPTSTSSNPANPNETLESATGSTTFSTHGAPPVPHRLRCSSLSVPSTACEACRNGPISAHLGLYHEPITYQSVFAEDGARTVQYAGGYVYSTSVAEFNAACPWCRFLRNNVIPRCDDPLKRHTPLIIRTGWVQFEDEDAITPEGSQCLNIIVNEAHRFTGYVWTTAEDPAARYIAPRSRILDVGTPHALALAKAAIVECTHGHDRCTQPPTLPAPLLPTRLIDCNDPLHPRLVTANGARGAYLALSYVWGQAQPHKTITSNISRYEDGIDLWELPKTIRDAIHVTGALGIRYLWVDSLCIIQDSVEDQQREIGRMRHIYRDAYCTIIAASAHRVSDGFLHDRLPIPHPRFKPNDTTLPFICPASLRAEAASDTPVQLGTVRLTSLQQAHISPHLECYKLAWEPISSRAWCMQELMMSPRSLIFASHTVQFRCQKATINLGGAYHDATYSDTKLPSICFLETPPAIEHGSNQWLYVRRVWREVVQDYTRRSITNPDDKLAACGGVAEEFHRVLRSDYLAGLWRDTLLVDLLWAASGPLLARPKEYRAPSWSWAALDGDISLEANFLLPPRDSRYTFAEVIRCEAVLENAALPFGRVTGASLVLRTPLITATKSMKRRLALSLDNSDSYSNTLITIDSESEYYFEGTVWVAPIRWRESYLQGIVVAGASADGTASARSSRSEVDRRHYRRIGLFDMTVKPSEAPLNWVNELPWVNIELV